MHASRRAFLGLGLAGVAAFRADRLFAAPPTALLPAPNFPVRAGAGPRLDMVVGRRPIRDAGFRLETENQGSKRIIHNYGHGGGGITLAPGCAQWIVENGITGVDRRSPVAVLGAGIVGLTAAAALRDAGFRVTVYSDVLPGEAGYRYVTSSLAGGQFAPSFTYSERDPRFAAILRNSARHYRQLSADWGVRDRDNYTIHESETELAPAVRALGRTPRALTSLPFQGLRHQSGYLYPTMLIETPAYLDRLYHTLSAPQPIPVAFRKLTFDSAQKVLELEEPTIVNCMGINGGRVFGLSDVKPASGLLVRLPPQSSLGYLYSGVGYVFPRSDYLIVGGSIYFPEGKTTNGKHDNADDGWKLIESARAVFRGDCPADYSWMSGRRRRDDLSGCPHDRS